jgi:organic radical activating enzyme
MANNERDYYCSMKFRLLKIDLTKTTVYTCDAAKPIRVDMKWLESHPGQLFNNKTTVQDRQLMLQNKRNSNCEQNCWPAEDKGIESPRLIRRGNVKTHTEIFQTPEIIDLTINSECNLSCSYCCKEFSSSWRKDIIKNGEYKITGLSDRYQLTIKDQTLNQISQPEAKTSKNFQILLNEVKLAAPTLKKLYVTGGEPLLDNDLIATLDTIPFNSDIDFNLFSGLGMSMSRFSKSLDKLASLSNKYKNFRLKISAESTDKIYEFNRYGNTWQSFQEKIDLLKQRKIKFIFHCTISNLTLFGLSDFLNRYKNIDFTMDFVHQPHMLSPHVLDDCSKQILREQIKRLECKQVLSLLKSIEPSPTEIEKLNLKEFLIEFTNRRPDLSLTAFPKSFLDWLEISNKKSENIHVV